ncbi:MAG: hypothetical protein M1840_000235 [Geoglossum simile]|nr:MAG: hypothetical protein M1840_000235 [Geoglossum simile]
MTGEDMDLYNTTTKRENTDSDDDGIARRKVPNSKVLEINEQTGQDEGDSDENSNSQTGQDEEDPDSGSIIMQNPGGDDDSQEKIRSTVLKLFKAVISIDDPATQSMRRFLVDSVSIKKAIVAGGDELMEIGKSLRSKWRQLEDGDLKATVAMNNRDLVEGEEPTATPKLADVRGKDTFVPVGMDDANNFLEVARAIISPHSILLLAEQVKYLIEHKPSDSEQTTVQNQLRPECYDPTGNLTTVGKIFQLTIDIVRIEADDNTKRIRHRYNCLQIAGLYEEEQAKVKESRKSDGPKRAKGVRGKGIATQVRQEIADFIGCTYGRLDDWIKLGKAITPSLMSSVQGYWRLYPTRSATTGYYIYQLIPSPSSYIR